MCLYSKSVLEDSEQKKIIGDVKCSDRMYDYVAKHGGEPIMWKTGHSLIKQKIKDEKAPFGGEMSGHIFFADRNYGYDDALYAGLRIVEILAKTSKTITELLSDLPTAYNTPELRIDTTEEKKHLIVEKLKQTFSAPSEEYKTNLIDGIRVSFKNGWALARASNTQPVLVMRFEADSEKNLQAIRSQFEDVVNPLL
jgi:phosphomannomutase